MKGDTFLDRLAKLIRYYILVSTTKAGSGHPTSCLSCVELMTALFFSGYFKYDVLDPKNIFNDRLIFSKGHAAPLLYSLWAAAEQVEEGELLTLRKFDSPLEGHPSLQFPYTEAATGSLGQGLSIGVGMALNAKIDRLKYTTYVLLGDGEMAEGSNWESIQIANHYKLNNLVGIIDVSCLEQAGETMYCKGLGENGTLDFQKRIQAFGWETIIIDGHSFEDIHKAYDLVQGLKEKPLMIIASTIKGKGVSFLEGKNNWHGKSLSQEQLSKAIVELGEIDKSERGEIERPDEVVSIDRIDNKIKKKVKAIYTKGDMVATRKACGNALVNMYPNYPNMVVLDAGVSNSTNSYIFRDVYAERFFEMYIAEQNMVGTALGLSLRGKIPVVSSFSAFLSRAYDQIRMSQYSDANIKFIGSHGGVSIGEDGPSQMGLADIAIFRSILPGVVLYPSDAVSTEKLIEQAMKYKGIVYIRTTRPDTPVIYDIEEFPIGGSKVLRQSDKDIVTVIGSGITLHEALKAYGVLQKENVNIRVIDLYSIKPMDSETLIKAAKTTKALIVVEDHYPDGGIGEAVRSELEGTFTRIYSLAVRKTPKSGTAQELLDYEEISSKSIVEKVREILESGK